MSGRGRWIGVAMIILVVGIGGAGAALAQGSSGGQLSSGKQLTVTPARGGTTTHFKVAFPVSSPTGTSSGQIKSIALTATGSGHARSGCVDAVNRIVNAARAGTTTVTLAPGAGTKARWCAGTFTGSVKETVRPNCHAGMACPQYIALLPIGSFRFTVR